LADNEEIRTVAAGDTVGWQIVSAGQHLFIKPMASNARTNLSVITSRRTYLFDLAAQSVSDKWDMTYLVKFQYPQSNIFLTSRAASSKDNPAAFNFDYKIKGSKGIRPSRVFDDGLFTFFQFANPRQMDLPAIFWMSPDDKESLINYRMEGNYVVVERVGEMFILRSGNDRVTVTNKRRSDANLDLTLNPN
jgi:type IV secretion system protein VirB9